MYDPLRRKTHAQPHMHTQRQSFRKGWSPALGWKLDPLSCQRKEEEEEALIVLNSDHTDTDTHTHTQSSPKWKVLRTDWTYSGRFYVFNTAFWSNTFQTFIISPFFCCSWISMCSGQVCQTLQMHPLSFCLGKWLLCLSQQCGRSWSWGCFISPDSSCSADWADHSEPTFVW